VLRAVNTARGIDTPRLVDRLRGRRPVVVAPHPDDEVIGAGGALLAHLAHGDHPAVVEVTSGERTAGLLHLPPAERAPVREAEARAACASLGLAPADVVFARLPDGRVGEDPGHAAALAQLLGELGPDLVYAPWPVDAHRDHAATTRLLAGILSGLGTVASVALYEVWSPLSPTHLVDITDHLEAKLDALDHYASALQSVDYRHTARGLAAYRSAQGLHGEGYSEAFCVLRPDAVVELLRTLDSAGRSPSG
jgi:N-acetylglucosamine malate deacetylase 1